MVSIAGVFRREQHLSDLERALRRHSVVALLGPRQVGKTTLARQLTDRRGGRFTFFDLENPVHAARLTDPMLALSSLQGLVVLDEVQLRPELFPVLRVLADRPRRPAQFLVLGSASPALLRQSSETLAGRIHFHELAGIDLSERGRVPVEKLWLRGGFPRAVSARSDAESAEWREDFVRTFLERDLPQLGIEIAAPDMRRLWTMLAHLHGQIANFSELARSLAISSPSARRWVERLADAFMVRILPPWHANLTKRQVKSPKVYLRDSGLLHTLLTLRHMEALQSHPSLGASWEGFALECLIRHLRVSERQVYFWATHQGAELDLLVEHDGALHGFELKHTSAPKLTESMKIALADLKLSSLHVVYPGSERWQMGPKVWAIPLAHMTELIAPFR
ncbi:MAG: ATP-binding protein [Myxococcaceae bacterium]|nr:ATP-binding protein [Myxococcaceae bacterium]